MKKKKKIMTNIPTSNKRKCKNKNPNLLSKYPMKIVVNHQTPLIINSDNLKL